MAIRRTKKKSMHVDNSIKASSLSEAKAIARNLGFNSFPFDVAAFARSIGISINYTPLEDDVSGMLKKSDDKYVITVNALHHPFRQTFTIAHELGHFFLHKDLNDTFIDKVFFRNSESNIMEREANNFAAEILMPEDSFKKFISENSSKISDISKYFGVSSVAVKVRAEILGYRAE